MRKMIVAALIVGVMMLGTFAIVEQDSEGGFFCKNTDFQDGRETKDCGNQGSEYPTPEGGHQGGGGDVPG